MNTANLILVSALSVIAAMVIWMLLRQAILIDKAIRWQRPNNCGGKYVLHGFLRSAVRVSGCYALMLGRRMRHDTEQRVDIGAVEWRTGSKR